MAFCHGERFLGGAQQPAQRTARGQSVSTSGRGSLCARPHQNCNPQTVAVASLPQVRPIAAPECLVPAHGLNGITPYSRTAHPRPSQPPPSPCIAAQGRSKLRVAVDVDEVLGRFLHSLNKFKHEVYGVEFDISDYDVYDFATVWKCSKDESNHIVHEFFESHHFALGIAPIPGAFETLQRLQRTCDLVVVTSRQHVIREPTLQWIDAHFPGVFCEVHFGNHFALSGESKKKSEICREIGATVLIDDNPRYAVECAEAGIDVLLYDWRLQYPWSKTSDGPVHSRIQRVRDWIDVETSLMSLCTNATDGQL